MCEVLSLKRTIKRCILRDVITNTNTEAVSAVTNNSMLLLKISTISNQSKESFLQRIFVLPDEVFEK